MPTVITDWFFEGGGVAASWLMLFLVPVGILAIGSYALFSLPLRRQERARLFLDLIARGLEDGKTPEETVCWISRSRDSEIGARFHLVAGYVAGGMRLVDALQRVPRFLPPALIGMLRVGDELGDWKRVLIAARHLTRDALSQMRGAVNYQIIILFVLNPIVVCTFPIMMRRIFPVFGEIFSGFGVKLPSFTEWLIESGTGLFMLQCAVVLILYAIVLCQLGGSRFERWVQDGWYPLFDWLALRIPWKRKRLQRDFTAMLGLLLDAGVAEHRALRLAASSTANRIFIRRAAKAEAQLEEGVPLPEAVRVLDGTGEFQWRLQMGALSDGGFYQALSGWRDALDAKAFQEEQTAAQSFTTLLVVLNGIVVAVVTCAMMQAIFRLGTMPLEKP
jgi:type II secretory pathway component PulF